MPRLPVLTAKKVERALLHGGFKFIRQHGSHRIYVKNSQAVTIPFHGGDLRKGTLKSIVKQSGLTFEEFFRLLSE